MTATRCPCRDCGTDTLPTRWDQRAEYYVVRDHVWAEAGADDALAPANYLCVGCIEARLGRHLTPDDFTSTKVNDPSLQDDGYAWSYRTPRLLARLTQTALF